MITRRLETGIKRFDDIIYGGFPVRSNILIYGPPFIGKEWLITRFLARGLELEEPVIVLLTNESAEEFRDILSSTIKSDVNLEILENKGLVKYIDAYTRIVGDETSLPGVYYIESFSNTAEILRIVDNAFREASMFKKPIRFGFLSVSTLVINLSPQAAFRLAYMIAGRVKRSLATGLYALDSGMHSESEVSTFIHLMDGIVEFKEEFEPTHKTSFRIVGLGQVKSRNWIEYVFDGSDLKITGSIAMGRIF